MLKSAFQVPTLQIETHLQPITRTILKVSVSLTPDFHWNNNVHGKVSDGGVSGGVVSAGVMSGGVVSGDVC